MSAGENWSSARLLRIATGKAAMNFALLGGTDALVPLLRAVADSAHQLTLAADLSDALRAAVVSISPGTKLVTNWQAILNDDDVEAVIAAPGTDDRDAGIKRLAAAGKAILLIPHGDPAAALPYELSLVRDDTGVPLVPLFPLRSVPEVAALLEGETKPGISLQMERSLPVAGSPPLLSSRDVYAALVYDADLLRQMGGDYSQVTAVFSGPSPDKIALATVTLAGDGLPTATWTLRPVEAGSAFKLALSTADGETTIAGETAVGEIPTPETSLSVGQSDQDPQRITLDTGNAVLRDFEQAVANPTDNLPWTNMIRSVEIVEAASRSIRRRRTIDLHFETTSERNQFKTQMTAIGCSLMMMTLVAFVFVLIAGALFNLNPAVMRVLRIGIFVPLFLFLLMQLLLFVSRPSRRGEPAETTGDESD